MSFLPRETTLKIDVPTGPVERLAETIKDVGSEARGASKATEELSRTVRDMPPGPTARLPAPRRRDTLDVAPPMHRDGPSNVTSGPSPATGGGGASGGGGMAAIGGLIGGNVGGVLAMAGPYGALAAAAIEAASAVKGLVERVIDLAGAASPGHMQLFQRAVADAYAVLGRFFVPVLDIATQYIRHIGDAMANILPHSQELRLALDPLKKALADMKDAIVDLSPYLKEMVYVGLAGLTVFVKSLSAAMHTQAAFIRSLGIVPDHMKPKNPLSSVGAAPSPAHWMGVEDIGKRAAEAAFSTGIPETATKTENYLERIAKVLDDLKQPILNALKFPGEVGKEAGRAIGANQELLMDAIKFAARNRRRMI